MPACCRRLALAAIATFTQLLRQQWADAAPLPPSPLVGDCPDCIGEVVDTLNVCSLESESCVSTQNDDEMCATTHQCWTESLKALEIEHAPQYDGDRNAAVASLLAVATGGYFSGGDNRGPISGGDAGRYTLGGVAAVVLGRDLPSKPKRQVQAAGALFDGVLAERHVTSEGSEYVRLTFGQPRDGAADVDDPSRVIDAEFLFLKGDSIVVIRAASRAEPAGSSGQLALSFSKGVVFEKNASAAGLERLRKALRWEVVPVITDFDPRFNNSKPLWFEKLYQPFLPDNLRSRQGADQSELPLVDGRRV